MYFKLSKVVCVFRNLHFDYSQIAVVPPTYIIYCAAPALSPSHHFNLRLFIYGLQTIQEWADVQREQLMDIIYLASKLQTKVFFTCAVDVYLCV